ncbi:GNAT family N-acetyltransferase [Abyssibacter profundi]|uniref:Phosphinothricin acetyltransferase n=1 Tax=Abyssibacter profundi TaxID=2182787 RepID=A0A363UQG4_9GAMM|nr:GNAT family N-acetyltransferase [Abyssibacter profundi]PWN57703.1 phosphinothricin acetyltransferase [Abyssibacter profundi]
MSNLQMRDATVDDAATLAAIYNPFITETVVTFEETVVTADDMAARVTTLQDQGLPWRVIEQQGRVLGYAYAGRWRSRAAYRYVAESAIYLGEASRGHGLGTRLYQDLFGQLRARGLRVVMGVIALPHPASVAFHERLGFRQAGLFPRVGYKFQRWIDVGYWQLELS